MVTPIKHDPTLRGFFIDTFGFTKTELKKYKLVSTKYGTNIIGFRDKFVSIDMDNLPTDGACDGGLRFCTVGCTKYECNPCDQMKADWSYVLSKDLYTYHKAQIPVLGDPEFFSKVKLLIISWLTKYAA
jgi:hypothetical protein